MHSDNSTSIVMPEIWKTVVFNSMEFPYQVSNHGRVRRSSAGGGAVVGRILKPGVSTRGYLHVSISGHGIKLTKAIHLLVAAAFLPEPFPGLQINHRDGIKTNNEATNLEWVTSAENSQHAIATGLQKPMRGQDKNQAKLTESDVLKIRSAPRTPRGQIKKLGEEFGVSPTTISDIQKRRRWKHI